MQHEERGDDEAEQEVAEGQVQDVEVGRVVGALSKGAFSYMTPAPSGLLRSHPLSTSVHAHDVGYRGHLFYTRWGDKSKIFADVT